MAIINRRTPPAETWDGHSECAQRWVPGPPIKEKVWLKFGLIIDESGRAYSQCGYPSRRASDRA